MNSKALLTGKFVTLLSFALASQLASPVSYVFSHNSREIYETVVAKDERNPHAPGIYKIHPKNGTLVPLLLGDPLGVNRSYKGVLSYVALTNNGGNHEILTIIDGKLTLLNYNTSPKQPTSYLQFGVGGKSGLKLTDLLSGTPVQLPPIKNIEEVQIHEATHFPSSATFPKGGKLYLVSVKAGSIMGKGITFAFIINGSSGNDKVSVYNDKVVVLAYEFMDENALDRLRSASPNGMQMGDPLRAVLYSPLLIQNTRVNLPDDDLFPAAKLWGRQLNRFQNYIFEGRTPETTRNPSISIGVPLYDFITGKIIYPQLPLELIEANSKSAGVVYDPFSRRSKLIDVRGLAGSVQSTVIGQSALSMVSAEYVDQATFAIAEVVRNPSSGNFMVYGESTVQDPAKDDSKITTHTGTGFMYFTGDQLNFALRSGVANEYANYEVLNLMGLASPGDKIEYIRLKDTKLANNRTIRTYLISRQGKKATKAQITALVVEDTGTLRVLREEIIYEGPHMTPHEMLLRTQYDSDGPLFDNITATHGVKAYRNENSAPKGFKFPTRTDGLVVKTVPYFKIYNGLGLSDSDSEHVAQEYLLALTKRPIVSEHVYFEEYDSRGARHNATGFYLLKRASDGSREKAAFIPGYPLFSHKERGHEHISHVVDSTRLSFPSSHSNLLPNVQVSIVPFLTQLPKKKKGEKSESLPKNFRLVTTLTADTNANITGQMLQSEIGFPYTSLAFTKIIQGIKNRVDEFHILMFFREDPKIPGSANAVVVLNGSIARSDLSNKLMTVKLHEPTVLYRGIVQRSEYRGHLKVDPDGSYYWDDEPTLSYDHPKKKIKKLMTPGQLVQARTAGGLTLRDAEHLKDSEIGVANNLNNRGGAWEIYSRESLKNRVHGLSEYFESLEKKSANWDKAEANESEPIDIASEKGKAAKENKDLKAIKSEAAAEKQIMDAFEAYLDSLVTSPSEKEDKIRVVLVEPSLKEKVRMALFTKLVRQHQGNGARFGLNAPKFRFFYAENNLDDVDMAEEFRFITEGRDKRNFLMVESNLLKQYSIAVRADSETEDQNEGADSQSNDSLDWDDDYYGYSSKKDRQDPKHVFKYDSPDARASLAALLASGGMAKSVRGWRRIRNQVKAVPTIIISTPDEWRQITTSEANRKEYEAGIYDSFQLNHDFLTASWSMWPPQTDRAPDDIKPLAKAHYNSDEMRVFPTLDSILDKAAKGEMRGKQTIVIVPADLKPIVQKLIMLRWASPDLNAAGNWSHSNRKLALFRLNAKDISQSVIQDNFRAITGASTARNAVLYGDLDLIEKMPRPVNQSGRNFSLRDPVRSVKDILDGGNESSGPSYDPDGFVGPLRPETAAPNPEYEGMGYEELSMELDSKNQQIEEYNLVINDLRKSFRNRALNDDEFRVRLQENQSELASLIRERESLTDHMNRMTPEGEQQAEEQRREARNVPHTMWWIAAEGKAIQPKRAKTWSLKSAIDRHAATILVGTEEELMQIEASMIVEAKYFSVREHFDVVHLSPPDASTRFRLLQALFERENVKALNLEFKLNEPSERDPREQLIYHFINRVEQIAYDIKMEKTTAFVKAFTALKNALSEDLTLRRSRQFDVRFVERLFTKVFPMPLNVEILEAKDPLNQLQNVDTAVRNLTKFGYEGSQDLKRRFVENILTQTRPTDSSRPIPNSQIIFGKTSKGKTFLIQVLFKMLGLVEYNPNKPSNAEADYIFINVAKLTAEATNDPDKIPVQKAIEYIYDLLSQPNGARAHIVLDDFHKATSVEVRSQLFQFIQGLFEARNGMITARSKDGKRVRDLPVQNLNIYMTINPASSEKARAEYIRPNKEYSPAELLKLEVLAAIAENGFKPEESVLARWSDIINIDNFPRSAKVPELGKRVRAHSRASREVILVDPEVIDKLVSKFEDANARELLSPAAAALTSIPNNAQQSRLYLVSVRENGNSRDGSGEGFEGVHGQVNLQELQSAVRKLTQIDAVRIEEPRSMLRYMAYIMQNFRLQVFNNLALNAHMTDTLRLPKPGMVNLLKTQFLLGMSTHILDNPMIPKGEMVVRPEQLRYFTRTQIEEFYAHFAKMRAGKRYFPKNFAEQTGLDLSLDSFVQGKGGVQAKPRTRAEVISRYIARLDHTLTKLMRVYLRVGGVANLADLNRWGNAEIKEWFERLAETNPDAEVGKVTEEILGLFLEFQNEFNSGDLTDLAAGNAVQSTFYDEVRLFGYMLDKAVSQLPWGTIGKFTFDIAEQSADYSLGTKTAFKEYISSHEMSPFSIATPEFMTDILAVAQSMKQTPLQDVSSLKQGFQSFCDQVLSNPKGGQP